MMLGTNNVNPSALFAKVFDVVPKTTAKTKNKYEIIVLIQFTKGFPVESVYLILA